MQAEIASGLDVVRQQALVETLKVPVPPLQAQRAHALDALAILIGEPAETMQITGRSLSELHAPPLGTGLPSQLLLHRPDVQQAERQLAAANADITVARAQFLPAFNLTAAYGTELMTLAHRTSGPDAIYNLALGAVAPVFEGGQAEGPASSSRAPARPSCSRITSRRRAGLFRRRGRPGRDPGRAAQQVGQPRGGRQVRAGAADDPRRLRDRDRQRARGGDGSVGRLSEPHREVQADGRLSAEPGLALQGARRRVERGAP